jgi:hypothetical protein
MIVSMNSKKFNKDMQNLVKYSIGFLDGAEKGKTQFLQAVGLQTIEMLKQYIDSNARANPQALHHVYEWHQTGSPSARLFDISYTTSNLGLSVKSTFRQSTTVKSGSTTAFYNKAKIMENGVPVTITAKRANVLSFASDSGEQVFTAGPVKVDKPGGSEVLGSYERIFDEFFGVLFRQSFLRASGIMDYLEKPTIFKKNFNAGKTGGRSKGITTGYRWILNAGLGGRP